MSGSGATCFGLYESDRAAQEAAASIAEANPGWWQMIGTLR
jgi:4-diphosphocytidyl-2-C-methyl-D-erythritol kinase